MALENYQSNVIKQIYGDDVINQNNVSVNEVENYYQFNAQYNDCIESPDLLTIVSSYHGFTENSLSGIRNESVPAENINKIGIPSTVVNNHLAYFKLLNDKDIDWENAYLRYSGNFQTCDPEKPIEYLEFTAQTGEDNMVHLTSTKKTTGNDYIFDRGLCSYINNTYDLMNIIDYLFIRLKALKFLFNVVKEQHTNMSIYREDQEKNQS